MSKVTSPTSTRRAKPAQGEDTLQPTHRVLRRFRLVFNAVKTHLRQVERQAGVGGAQLWALSVVRERPGIGVGDLARAMDIHQSTASNLVRGLVEQQLLVVLREGMDRRSVQIKVTPAGQRVLKRAPSPFTGVLPEALASLDATTLKRLDRDLASLLHALGVDDMGAGSPDDGAPRRQGRAARGG